MILLKKWKDDEVKLKKAGLPIGWHEISADKFDKEIERLSNCWKPETVIPMLKEGQTLWTMWAWYRIKN